MAEEQRGSRGKSYGNHKSYGSGKPGDRGGKGFKPRGNGGKSYGHKSGGFHKGGRSGFGGKGGYRGNGPRRDGEGFKPRREGGYRSHEGENGENPRYQHRDNDRRDFRRDGERRNFRRDDDRRDGDRRNFRRDDRRDDRRDFRRDDRRDNNRRDGEFREFSQEEKRQYREEKRSEYMRRPRRNSDGTMSFPSQNPYTDRRPDEPKMPKGMEWSMLSKDERERLRGLSKEHAENIGLHILAAFALEESDPELALEHAKWVARQASRIDFARETLAFVAYRQGDYKLALREFRTAYRMNGFLDYLPFIADCERGNGDPKKAMEVVRSDDAKALRGEAKAEMFLVYAGALADLKMWDKAIEIVHTLGRSKGLPGEYRMRAVQAEQYFLDECGRTEEAAALDDLLDRLETQYAEADEDETVDDVIIDHDMEHFTDDELDMLGISEDDAQFAPDDYDDMYGGSEDGYGDESDDAESDDSDDSADAEAGQNPDAEDEASLDGPLADEEELPAKETEEGAESFTDPADQNADDTGEAADEAEDAEPAEADDAQTAEDAAEPAAEAQDE